MASEGSFCLVRNGSPWGHLVPETMLTFGPTTGPAASGEAASSNSQATSGTARAKTKEKLFIAPALVVAYPAMIVMALHAADAAGSPGRSGLARAYSCAVERQHASHCLS